MDYTTIYEELKVECLKTASLIDSLKLNILTPEQKEEIESDLYAQISVVRIKTEVLETSIDNDNEASS